MNSIRSVLMPDEVWSRVKIAAVKAGQSAGAWVRDVLIKELDRLNISDAFPETAGLIEGLRAQHDAAKREAIEAQINGMGTQEITKRIERAEFLWDRLRKAERLAK